jgi:hypothetical protein
VRALAERGKEARLSGVLGCPAREVPRIAEALAEA